MTGDLVWGLLIVEETRHCARETLEEVETVGGTRHALGRQRTYVRQLLW